MRKLFFVTLLIGSLLAGGPAWAGWIIEQTTQGMTSTIYIQDNKFRQNTDPGQYTIFDVDKGLIYFVRTAKKMYAAVRPEEMAQQTNQMMGDMMKQMEEQLKGMPEDQKKMILKQMKDQFAAQKGQGQAAKPAPQVKVIKTSVREKIAGYSTVKYQIMSDGKLAEEMWLADDIRIGKEIDMDKMEKMMSKMNTGLGNVDYQSDPAVIKLFHKGYPLKEFYPRDNVTTETRKVTETNISADKFKIPAGYRKGKFSEVMTGQ